MAAHGNAVATLIMAIRAASGHCVAGGRGPWLLCKILSVVCLKLHNNHAADRRGRF